MGSSKKHAEIEEDIVLKILGLKEDKRLKGKK